MIPVPVLPELFNYKFSYGFFIFNTIQSSSHLQFNYLSRILTLSDTSDDFGEVSLSTLATLDNPIRDEYDRDVMENLDNVADEYPDAEVVQDRIVWDHPSFTDISAWEIYRPSNWNVRVHHPNSPDLREDTIFSNKENVMLVVQRYSILNRVEFRVRKSDGKKLVLECRKGEEICPWRLRVVVMARTSYWMVCKYRGDHALQDSSPNNFVKWDVTPLDDGTMQYNAKLLIAIGLDANNHILPLAFALVESENNSSWKWFMSCIRQGVTQREGLCVVSDRHAGILADMRESEWCDPKAYHRVCVRHFQSNFMTKAFDHGGFRWGNMTTNASECLNKILKNGRDLPVLSLVMYTFKQISTFFVKRSQSPYNNERALFPPKICERLAELRARAEYHMATLYNPVGGGFDVLTRKNHVTYKVCLATRTCSCVKWTLLKYPCSHAIAACRSARVDYTDYVLTEYTLEAYYRTWGYFFNPLLHEDFWCDFEGPIFVPNPRFKRNKAGRPPTRRRRNEMDQRHLHLGESSS
ncbi:hypothetical protein QQ045_012325 [Rhodiola kirilowii]